ncbi:MAG: type I restriction endonuclease subunit R, partial [Bacilli bacterium]
AFSVESFDGYRKDIMKRMKQKNLPQIDLLLVVDMFLTGFDSKPTNTLILDKNLVWHSLVQAYSRTNRVDRVTKQYGQIITYRNIKKWQDEALRLYSGDGNASDYLLESYEYYVAQFHNEAGTVKSVAPTPDDIGHLQSEDDIRKFIIAFRKLSQTLATLKTFGKFDQLDINSDITEQEYADYKSWYLYYYDQQKQKAKEGEETIYADLDFNIELIRTDRINVVYILNLLRDVDRSDTEKMTKDADLILRELERSDNAKLRSKKELMKEFIMTRFFQLKPEEDIMQAYGEFEKDSIEKDISSFSDKTGISRLLTEQLISQYFADPRTLTNEIVRKKLEADGIKGILRQTSVTEGIMGFAEDMKDKYTGEDE